MTETCSDLVSFVDGELDAEHAEAFRAHLRTCDACQTGLVEAMQLSARLSTLEPAPEHTTASEPRLTDAIVDRPHHTAPTPWWGRRLLLWGGGMLAPAALVTYLLMTHTAPPDTAPPDTFADLKTRPYEVRFALAGAAAYRGIAEANLGSDGPTGERISYAALDRLDKRGDKHALAIGRAWNHEKLGDVAQQLAELPQTPPVRSDHAAIELVTTKNENIEPVLAELEALRGDPDVAVARAARWNYAFALSRLGLRLSAAKAFREIADEHEPGWSEEALKRAESQDKAARDVKQPWDRAQQAGQAMTTGGALVPIDLVEKFPGMMRAHFYNAVRTASDRDRVLALGAIADALDRVAGQTVLRGYVRRVAAFDFRRRAPLARAYAQVLAGEALDARVRAELTTDHPSPDVADIVIGAMVQLDVAADHLEAFRELTRQIADPWFEILRAQTEADIDRRNGDWFGAETQLRNAQKQCGPAIHYRCLYLADDLGHLYQDLHRIPDALRVLQDGLRIARSSGEWGRYLALLLRTADAERFNSSIATARAYANELVLMAPSFRRYTAVALSILAEIAIHNLDGRAARGLLEQALHDAEPTLAHANDLADIARLDPQPGDLGRLQDWLTSLRQGEKLTHAERIYTHEIEGRLLVDSDRAAGTAALERAIAAADAARNDPVAQEARDSAYAILGFDAARQGQHDRVLSLMAAQFGLPAPGPCTVAMLAEYERVAVAVRGSDGQDRGTYWRRRKTDDPVAVPADLTRGLAACAHVGVMAQPTLQGTPGILPDALAWGYLGEARGRRAAAGKPPGEPRAVIVADVNPPSDLQLDPLSPWPSNAMPSATRLSGDGATPARVLSEIRTATEIHFHTHAIVDSALSDASHLVLSPDANGNYALTAEALRHVALANPVVVLAACHSAKGARMQHKSWSLPQAFLSAGARAVFASASNIPDRETVPFYLRVLDRVRSGAAPASVLRDERLANPSSWIASVIIFE